MFIFFGSYTLGLNVGLNLMFFKEDFYACAVFPLKGHYTTGVGPKLNMSALLLSIKMWVFLFIISYIWVFLLVSS